MIRRATIADIPFVLKMGLEAYHYMDGDKARVWLLKVLADENSILLRGEHSFGIANAFRPWYWRKPRGFILHVASKPQGLSREALLLVGKLVEWTREKGCFEVIMGSEIGVDYGPFAKLLGATKGAPSYVIKFDKEPQYA
jgi:hypothetical protein